MKTGNSRFLLIAACGMVLFICMGAIKIIQFGTINIRVYQAFVALGLIGIINSKSVVLKQHNISRIFYLAFSFIFICFISMLVADYPIVTLKQTLLLFIYFLVSYVGYKAFNTSNNLKVYFITLIIGSLIAYTYGYLQTIFPNIFHIYLERRNIGDLGAEINFNSLFYRPSSFFSEGNEFGQFISFSSAMFIACSVYSVQRWIKILSRLSLIYVLPILMINNSRGTIIAIAGMVVVMFMISYKINIGYPEILKYFFFSIVMLLVSILLLVYLILPNVPIFADGNVMEWMIGRISGSLGSDDSTFYGRLIVMWDGLLAFVTHPILGVGYGNMFTVIDQFGYAQFTGQNMGGISGLVDTGNATSTNFFIDIAAETGIFGLIFFVSLLVKIAKLSYRNITSNIHSLDFPFALGSHLAFWGMLINSLSYSAVGLAIFWLNVGVILGMSQIQSKKNTMNYGLNNDNVLVQNKNSGNVLS